MPTDHFGLRIWKIKCRMMSLLLSKYCPSTEADESPTCSMNLFPTFQASINLSLLFISAAHIVYPKVYREMLQKILHGMLIRLTLVQSQSLVNKTLWIWVKFLEVWFLSQRAFVFYFLHVLPNFLLKSYNHLRCPQ